MNLPTILDFASLKALYAAGATPLDLVDALIARMNNASDPAIFISRTPDADLRVAASALMERAPQANSLPLWGIPFAVKDNIDVLGLQTTAGCPAFAYDPQGDAAVIARLREAGALVIGKTNLDQFATGLNGTRSPHGAPRSVFNADYVSGGSSSGSAVAVASGFAAFSLGTDTAGSGRVPAAFNNLVGIKPTPGRISTKGVVPACRSVDVITVFANSVGDGVAARKIAEAYDGMDPFSRDFGTTALPATLTLGVLTDAEKNFYGNDAYAALYEAAIERARALGATIVEFDYAPFRDAAALLYQGPWVAERLAAIEPFMREHADQVDPTVRTIIEGGARYSAVDAFNARYALERFIQQTRPTWQNVDALLLPTSADIQTVAAMKADPIALNSRFGLYTNFANLMGLSAIAVPAGFTDAGLPFGVTLVGPGDSDEALAPFAAALHQAVASGSGLDRAYSPPPVAEAPSDNLELVVVGAHLSGMVLNHELLSLGAHLVEKTSTAPFYRLYALAGTVPPKPGLQREPDFSGPGILVEVWSVPPAGFGRFVSRIPTPLGVGKVQLADGRHVTGFLCENAALTGARDITSYGGWRSFVESSISIGS